MGAFVVALMLNWVFIICAFNQSYAVEVRNESFQLQSECVTNIMIFCDQGLVLLSVCCTRANDQSDVIVHGLCPYIPLTDQEIKILPTVVT